MDLKNHIRPIAISVLFAVLFGFIAVVTFIVFREILFANDSASVGTFKAAFMGAFFAFLFVRLADALTRIYQRQAKNHTTLVQLEHQLNDCLDLIGDDIFVIDQFLQMAEHIRSEGTPRVYMNELHPLPLGRELFISLTNIDLINELLTLYVDFRKLNDTMATLNRFNNQVRTALVAEHINRKTYVENIEAIEDGMKEVKKFLLAAKSDAIRLLASVSLLAKEEPVLGTIIRLTTKTRYDESFKRRLPIEIENVERDVAEIAEKSGQRIKEIQDGTD